MACSAVLQALIAFFVINHDEEVITTTNQKSLGAWFF